MKKLRWFLREFKQKTSYLCRNFGIIFEIIPAWKGPD